MRETCRRGVSGFAAGLFFRAVIGAAALALAACSPGAVEPVGSGGATATGGAPGAGSGGSASGGAPAAGSGGAPGAGSGGSGTGGASATGGMTTSGSGGASTGGAPSGTGGMDAATGGRGTGGATPTGGAAGGRSGAGGSGTGGAGVGGAAGGTGGPPIVDLFNGTDLTGWTAYRQVNSAQGPGTVLSAADARVIFKPEAGQIRVYGDQLASVAQARHTLVTAMSYSKYNFFLEYKWGTKTYPPYQNVMTYPRDAGILYHLHGDRTVVWPSSAEFQIKDGTTGDLFALYARCTSTARNGGTTFVDAADGGTPKIVNAPNGNAQHGRSANFELPEWNSLELQVNGGAAVFIVNGHIVNRVLAVNDRSGTVGVPVTSGPIALQAEHAEVFYRNIRIQVLP